MQTPLKNGILQGTLNGTATGGTINLAACALDVATQTGGNNTTKVASTAFVASAVAAAVTGLYDPKGSIDCAANPNYPAALVGDVYWVSVAGKIGGASGRVVEAGDTIVATADNAGGTQAGVGASWVVTQNNIDLGNIAITGGTIDGVVIGQNAPLAGKFTNGDFSGNVTCENYIRTNNNSSHIYTNGSNANIGTEGGGYVYSRSTFKLSDGTFFTTLSHTPTANRALALPDASGTLLSDATPVTLTQGGTGATDAAGARTNLGLGTLATQSGTFSGTSSGTNTGDQTSVSGNAGTATTLATGRTLAITGDLAYTSPSFNGGGNVTAAGTLATVNSNAGAFGSATQSLTLTANAKGLITAVAAQTVTPAVGSITGLASGVAAFLATPSSANLAAAVTDETGTGALVFATSPTLTTPILGTPTSGTLTNCTWAAKAASGTNADITTLTALTAKSGIMARPATFIFEDDFVAGDNSSGNFGLGWRTNNITLTSTYNYASSDAGHPGQLSIVTTALASAAGSFYGGGNAGNLYPFPTGIDTVSDFEFNFVFNLSSVAGVKMYIGVTNDQTNVASNSLLCLRFDTSLGDTQWTLVSKLYGATSTLASGVTATTGWHTARIVATAAGTWKISIDGGALTASSLTTNLLQSPGYWFICCGNDGAASKTLLCDYFSCRIQTTR